MPAPAIWPTTWADSSTAGRSWPGRSPPGGAPGDGRGVRPGTVTSLASVALAAVLFVVGVVHYERRVRIAAQKGGDTEKAIMRARYGDGQFA